MIGFLHLVPSFCYAELQRVDIPSSFNPVGSGARALGMGGAFIAIADDATAASWNPGGLIQLETPEVSIVGAYFNRKEDLTFGNAPEANSSQEVSNGNVNYLSAAYPFNTFNRNMIISVNYQHLYDMTRDWNYSLNHYESGPVSDVVTSLERELSASRNIIYEDSVGISTIGTADSIQATPNISVGITINYWGSALYNNGWDHLNSEQAEGNIRITDDQGNLINESTFTSKSSVVSEYTIENGFNTNIGLMWNVNNKISLGAVLKTPFEANLNKKTTLNLEEPFPGLPIADVSEPEISEENQNLYMPLSYGIGAAYRFTDNFSASFDIYRTEWDDFILTDEDGNKTSPISGKDESESSVDPTHQVRLGTEYLYIGNKLIVPIRGGVFYDPAPAEGSPDDFYGFALGSGIVYKKIVFDMAYQYRWGNDVGQYIMETQDFSADVKEHTIYASLIYHF